MVVKSRDGAGVSANSAGIPNVSKTSYAMISLVAALPAAFGLYVMTMVFIRHSGNAKGMMLAAVGLTWLCALVLVCMPVLILLFAPKGPEVAAPPAAAGEKAAASKKKGKEEEAEELDDFGGDDDLDDLDDFDK